MNHQKSGQSVTAQEYKHRSGETISYSGTVNSNWVLRKDNNEYLRCLCCDAKNCQSNNKGQATQHRHNERVEYQQITCINALQLK